MKHIKVVLLTMLMAVFGSHTAMASNTSDSLAYAFGDSADMGQIELLTPQEMDATEGDWFRFGYRAARHVWRNTKVDGYNGSRVVQVRWKSKPVFRLDYKSNPSPTKLHMHFGNMKHHRPWHSPWRRY